MMMSRLLPAEASKPRLYQPLLVTAGIILTCYGLLTAVSTLLSILRERIEVNRASSVDAFRDRIIVHSKRIVITMTPPPTAYSMLLGRFVFCVVSIGVAPSLVMPAKSLAADKKVDCGKILTEIESGKSAQEVAKMMGISTSSVYRCEKRATTSIPSASSSPIAIPTPSVPSH
jgi:hypothetical protein